jgi:hypothetical protein
MNNVSFISKFECLNLVPITKTIVEVHMNFSCPFNIILSIWMKHNLCGMSTFWLVSTEIQWIKNAFQFNNSNNQIFSIDFGFLCCLIFNRTISIYFL